MSKLGKNSFQRLPSAVRGELVSYLGRPRYESRMSHYDFEQNRFVFDTAISPHERVFAFANETANLLNLPFDMRCYIDKAAAARLKKYGFKKAKAFIEERCGAVSAALAVLPEPWWRVDTPLKRAKLAVELAGRCGNHVRLTSLGGLSALDALAQVNEFVGASLWLPAFGYAGADEEKALSFLVRLLDEGFWKRSIERLVFSAFENARRAAGMVSPHVSPYASHSACEWLQVRQDRQREWIELMAIESEAGEQVALSDVVASSQSNPANRRNELMTRIAGCQEYAQAQEHVALFVTMTAPSRFHRLRMHGKYWVANPKFDGSTPKGAQAWLCEGWSKFRAWAGYRGLSYYGMRVVEPHQDGTPHWHGVFFMPLEQVKAFMTGLSEYQFRDGADLYDEAGKPLHKAMKARFHAKLIDESMGGAVAYLAKYISKNVDGYGLEGLADLDNKKAKLCETVRNVTAWSRTFCFRQFQFQNTPSVGVWRELRRIDEQQEWCLFEKARRAADLGYFSAYMDYMGGHRLAQSFRPIKLLKEGKENRYGEAVTKTVGVEGSGLVVFTREIEWKLVKKSATSESELEFEHLREDAKGCGSSRPRSSGNNCRILPVSPIVSDFFLKMELDRFDVDWQEWIKTGEVSKKHLLPGKQWDRSKVNVD